MLHEMMFEAKVKEQMGVLYQDLVRAAAIENRLTGTTKVANEEQRPEHQVDSNVSLMSNPAAANPTATGAPNTSQAQASTPKGAAPPGLNSETAKRADAMKRQLKLKPDAGTPAPNK